MTTTAQVASLPDAARRNAARADEIHRQVYGPRPGEEAPPAAEAAPEAPVAEAQPQIQQPTPPEQPAQQPAQQQQQADDDWQNKYNVLKGKYNKEVLPLQQQVRTLTSELDAMRSVIASMEVAAPAAPAASVPGFTTSGQQYITEADVEDFGEETIDMMRRAARAEAEQQNAALLQRIAQLETQLHGVGREVQMTAREKLFSALDARVPNWRDVNRHSDFLQWLQESDPYSGMQRHALLTKAFEANDAARVLVFFEGFLGEHAMLSESQPAQTTERQPQVDLETLVAPGRPKSSPARAQEGDGKRIWTPAEIKAFYRDVQNKRFVGRDKERVRIEQDIVAAGREGRVRASVNPF